MCSAFHGTAGHNHSNLGIPRSPVQQIGLKGYMIAWAFIHFWRMRETSAGDARIYLSGQRPHVKVNHGTDVFASFID
jgi:hypothetical protein